MFEFKLSNVMKRNRLEGEFEKASDASSWIALMRPTDLGYVRAGVVDLARIPFIPLGMKFAEELYYMSDVLRTVIRSLVWETFRNGIYIEPKFKFKCMRCGATYNEPVERCEVCGSTEFRGPSRKEKERLEKWVEKANINDQSLIEVLKDIDFDLNIYDNAYVIVRKEYYFDDEGKIVGAKPIEVIRGDVHNIRLVISNDGRPGYTPDGETIVMFCPIHRDRAVQVSPEEYEEKNGFVKCPVCGRQMMVAYAEYSRQGKKIFLGPGEVLHVKKFTHGFGYGYPMPLTLAMKILILMKMDYYVLMSYHIQRPPKGILILRANREAVAKAWQFLEEATRVNPWRIVPLVIEGTEKLGSRRVAEWIDLSLKVDETAMMAYRDELRRSIGMAYGVSPIFQGDLSTGAGLANQGLQITVTNRAVEEEQRIFNEKILPWILKQLGISDWVVKLKPHEEKDLTAQIQREQMRVNLARMISEMGYKVELTEGPDGIDFKVKELDITAEFMLRLKQWLKANGIELRPEDVIELIKIAQAFGGLGELKAYLKQVLDQMKMQQMMQALGGGEGVVQATNIPEQEEQETEERKEEKKEESPLDKIIRDLLFGGEERFEGEPEGSRGRVYGKNREMFEGMPELNRKNLPGMEGLKINREERFEGQPEEEGG